MVKRRDRDNLCGFCEHYHEEGETCDTCGHLKASDIELTPSTHAYPSEILPEFLYLGGYDAAFRKDLHRIHGISHTLNTVPACRKSDEYEFYHKNQRRVYLPEGDGLDFEGAIGFLRRCEEENGRVLVHCMSGKSRSPAFVIAYLMKTRRWRFEESLQWVKDRRPCVDLRPDVCRQLLEFETKVFGSDENGKSLVRDDDLHARINRLSLRTEAQ